jgi:hypothetical protein
MLANLKAVDGSCGGGKGVMWTGLIRLRIGTGGESCCEFGIEPSGSINYRETIECPNNWGPLE